MDVQICRARSNAILTTSRTVLADDPAMTVRRSELPELVVDNYPMDELRQPDLVVLDSKASVSPKARIFEERSRRVFLVVSSTSVISRCYPDNCTVITYDGVDGELAGLFRLLAADYSINDLWVEAGACLTNSLLRQNLFNEYIVYMAPKLLGRDGIHMNHLEQYFSLEQVPCFSFKQIEKIGDDLKIILEPVR
jgi:diaminohydroxyphosphoribosylaminopyrimidine deaminase/5-amino-6-(5-phosphoribosylamino)uracil reductase